MASYNHFTLVGHAGNDPQRRDTPNGVVVATFSVAENQFRKGTETTVWWRVAAFGVTAERVLERVRSGDLVLVDGHLQIDEREVDGRPDKRYEVIATAFRVLVGKRDKSEEKSEEDIPW